MVILSHLSLIRFSGADAGSFLHSQLSADVLALSSGESTFACYCEPKGRVIALMLVFKIEDDYFTLLSASLASLVNERLKIYVMRSKVAIEVQESCTISGLEADAPADAVASCFTQISVPGSDKLIAIDLNKLIPATDVPAQDAWKVSELQSGITWLGPKTSGQFLPQMLGFDKLGAVNYRKGCYPGQEIVARTHYLGKVKRHPRVLCTSAIICPAPLEKLKITSNEDLHEAFIADCAHRPNGSSCLFVITRLDPAMNVDSIEYHGQIAPLVEFGDT